MDDDDDGGAPAAASATLSFSMGITIPCDERASFFLTQAQGERWGLIDVGAVYNVPGLAAIAGRDRQLLFHCAGGRGRDVDETPRCCALQVGESLQCSSGMW